MPPMLVNSPFRKMRRPELGLRVYANAADVASGSRSPCIEPADPTLGFARGRPSVIVSVCIPFY